MAKSKLQFKRNITDKLSVKGITLLSIKILEDIFNILSIAPLVKTL